MQKPKVFELVLVSEIHGVRASIRELKPAPAPPLEQRPEAASAHAPVARRPIIRTMLAPQGTLKVVGHRAYDPRQL